MRKLLALLACIPLTMFSQNYNVTFRVNTANITVGPNGMYAGGGVLGGSNAVALSDPDADGIWEGTAVVNGVNGGNFVFFNSPSHGSDWGTKEVLTGLPCADPANYDDRILPTFGQDTTLQFCFGSCDTDGTCPAPPATNNVTFSVDMNQYSGSFGNAYINGSFNGWCGTCNQMDDSDGDGIWTVTLPLSQDSIEYKFTLDGWSAQENFTPGASCTKTTGPYTNRFLAIGGDTTLATVCYNSCTNCQASQANTYTVNFQVNTANITVGPNGIYAGGGILGDAMAVQMTDADNDGVWEGSAVVNGANGGNFVFLNSPTNGGDWNTKEDLAGLTCADPGNWNDRIMPFFSQDTTLSFCFGSCETDGTCPTPPSDFVVSFAVNTANITVGPNGLFVGGGMIGWADALQLVDPDGDGIYTGDTLLPGIGGARYFAFYNSPTHPGDWNTKEDLAGLPCADPNNYNDRIMPSFTQDTTMLFCFGSCDTDGSCPAPPTTNDVTFSVDMNQYGGSTANGVFVNGSFNGWCGNCNPMDDSDGDGVWTVTLPLTQDSIEYKFTVDGWNDQENFSPGGSCTKTAGGFTNRFLTITGDVVLPSVCWNSCSACVTAPPGTNDVTFSVDMNSYPYSFSTVYVSGNFNGWSGDSNPLADADGDGVWEGTYALTSDSIEFKYTLDDWDNEEVLTPGGSCTKTTSGFTNRFLAISGDVTLTTSCFESCSACIPAGSYTVTFRVNTSNITVGPNGIYAGGGVLGGSDAVALTDIGNGVWEGSAVVNGSNGGNFVFFNSPSHGADWGTKEVLAGLPCSDPANYDDRIMPTFSQDTTLLFCFGSCETDGTCPTPATPSNVTFAVDMNQYGGSTANGVFVNGDFNGWCGNCNAMDDSDGDGVWTVTLPLTADSIEYKFTVDGWNDQESLTPGSSCTKTTGSFTNRFLAIGGDTTLATVCWNSCSGCVTAPPPSATCSELFFSEYGEGSSYNKYFEIYNPSNAPISLSGYTVYLSGNGGSFTNTFTSNAVIDSNDVFVIANASADAAILAIADTALSGYSVAAFNGDDALILVSGSDTIDVIGVPGVDPGSSWPVGSGSTANKTLVRMIGIDQGSTDWAVGATEWDVYSSNDWTFIGSHASACHGATPPPPTSFTVTFRVNTANITVGPNGMYAGGGVLGGADALALTDVGGGIWEGSALLNGSNGGNFVFLNSPAHGGDWGTKEVLAGLPCSDPANYDDRILPTFTQDTTLLFCFGTCSTDGTCPAPPATNDITFSVDMNQYAGSTANGVFVNGNFNGWCGNCNAMDDSDSDGVWMVTLPLTQDSIEYKFTVDGWNDQENFTSGSSCTKTSGGYTNRFLTINGDTTLSTVCWNSCSACPTTSTLFTVTFRVNTANITVGPNGMYAGGGVLGGSDAVALTDIGGGVWEGSAVVNGVNSGNFAFFNSPAHGSDWGTKENLTGLSCADPGNYNDRILPTFTQDTTLLFCFGSCETDGTCPTPATPSNVTFAVDMNQYGGSTANGVFVNGDFNGWCGNCNAMDDSDGDGVWTVTLPLTADSIEYKFTVDGWNDQESLTPGSSCTKTSGQYTNRFLAISGDTTLATVCWNSCSGCTTTPPPSNDFTVTFRVNTANITVGPNGMYAGGGVLGDAVAVALTDIGGGIWEGSALLNGANGGNFVFLNSPAHGGDWGTKENLTGLSCADPANWNDRIMPTFSQDTTLLFCFGSCETDGTCPTPATPSNVTFAVDMNQYGGSTANGVFVNGDFNGWCGNCNAMDDSDGDGVWTVTLPLTADSIEYKFTVDGWNDQESLTPGSSCTKTSGQYTNRFLVIGGDTTLATVCWNSCGSCAPTLPTGVTLDANGCVECDSLNVGDFFVLNGDSMEVVDRARLLAIVAAQGDLSKVCVSHITDMKNALRGYTSQNYDISHWDVSNVTNMNSMFFKNRQFNQDISTWDMSSVTNTIGMFTRCDSFDQDLNAWDMSQVTNMNRMFKDAVSFDGAIDNWDVENVVRMSEMFSGATSFNQDLSDWCVRAFQYNPPINFALNASSYLPAHYPRWGNCPQDFDNVTSLATGAFVNNAGCVDCSALNIGDYFELGGDTLLVVDRAMLDSLILLHDDLSKVCVSNITDMKDALRGLRWFNTDIAYWDVSNVTDMSNMFFKAQIFNQDIGNWDVSSVTRMSAMFQVARVFDQDISAWDVSNVQRFRSMFRNASAFNQNIGGWDVSNVLNDAQMSSMFRGCASFNQDLSMWCVSNVAAKPSGFDANSALVTANLPQWGTCPGAGTMIGNDNPIASDEANGDDAANQAEMQEIALSPNPTTGKVKISPVVEGTYRIYNEVGRTIGEGQIKEAYDFSAQPRGIYMLMLQTENGTQYLKVVKQ